MDDTEDADFHRFFLRIFRVTRVLFLHVSMTTRIVCISDTHSLHWRLSVPDGDILIHAGDLTNVGDIRDVYDFNDFLGELPHPHKIVIAGNHDFCFERDSQACREILTNCVYLEDEAVQIDGINFYGSPWQPWFCDWAFNLQRGPELKAKWDLIPAKTDVLITHGPPYRVLDCTSNGQYAGCQDLLEAIERIQPRVHVFGHIHEGFGTLQTEHTAYINASSCTASYRPINPAAVYEYEKSELSS